LHNRKNRYRKTLLLVFPTKGGICGLNNKNKLQPVLLFALTAYIIKQRSLPALAGQAVPQDDKNLSLFVSAIL
jgi:hypothetical protein